MLFTMGEGNLLSLRWNNHISNFKYTLGQLQQRELFSDATIACEGQFYPVHKFVLSTCSDYFAGMFERTVCKHPVIVLSDVSARDAQFLLSYMYGGEVSVSQTDLPSLIRAAETLQIKGLSAPDDPPISPSPSKKKLLGTEDRVGEKSSKKPRLASSSGEKPCLLSSLKKEVHDDFGLVNEDGTEEMVDETSEISVAFSSANPIHMNTSHSNFFENTDFPAMKVKQEKEEIAVADSSNAREESSLELKSCQLTTLATSSDSDSVSWPSSFIPCSSSPSSNRNINSTNNASNERIDNMRHLSNPLYPRQSSAPGENCQTVDSKQAVGEREQTPNDSLIVGADYIPDVNLQHSLSSFRCPLCEYATHNRSWLFIHIRKHTGEKPFLCPFCSFRSAQRGNLNVHIKKLHSALSSSSYSS